MNRYGPKKLTKNDHRAALQMFLLNATDKALAGVDAEMLARRHGLSVAECGRALELQRAHRAARVSA